MLDEDLIEKITWRKRKTVIISSRKIKKRVAKILFGENRRMIRTNQMLRPVIAAVALILASIPVYAAVVSNINESHIVDTTDQTYLNKEIDSNYYIIHDKNGVYHDSEGRTGTLEEIESAVDHNKKSNLIQDVMDDMEQDSFVEIRGKEHDSNEVEFPEIALVNDSGCILTKEDGSGWHLKEGDELVFNFYREKSKGLGKNLIIGYIENGTLKRGEATCEESGTFAVKAENCGTYYICLIDGSSEYLVISNSNVSSKDNH